MLTEGLSSRRAKNTRYLGDHTSNSGLPIAHGDQS